MKKLEPLDIIDDREEKINEEIDKLKELSNLIIKVSYIEDDKDVY